MDIEGPIPTGDGSELDADIVGDTDAPALAVVVAHPHPDFGGNRFDRVVSAICDGAVAADAVAIRFDFRSSDPDTARADAEACCDVAGAEWPDAALVLAGYSFGAATVSRIDSPAVAGWFLVAPPTGMLDPAWPGIAGDRPIHVVAGAHDDFSHVDALRERITSAPAGSIDVVPTADHFFAGHHRAVRDGAAEWFGALRDAR